MDDLMDAAELLRLRLVTDHLADALTVFDADKRIVYLNRAARDIIGTEGIGKRAEELDVPPDLLERWSKVAEAAVQGGVPLHYEYSWPTDTGERRFDVQSLPLPPGDRENAMLTVLRDVTERYQSEMAVRENERRYRTLVEISPDVILIHDESTIIFVNEAGARMLGANSAAELVGRPVLSIVHPDDRAIVTERIQELLAKDVRAPFIEERFLRCDGSVVEVEVAAASFVWQGRRLVNVMARDLTERKRAARQLQASYAGLAQAQKMEAIGQLAGGIAHDFNNLLTIILSQCDFIHDAQNKGNDCQGEVAAIRRAAERGTELINRLLSFARRQTIQPQAVDLSKAIASLAEMLRRLLGVAITVRTALPDEAQIAQVDPGHFEQVVLNLALNARDAMPDGGTLTIGVAPHDPGLVAIYVADTGTGIAPEVRAHLFEPFFTTKPVGKGSGLGLASALGIVEQSGGRIEVESTPGQGSCFTVLLPRSQGR